MLPVPVPISAVALWWLVLYCIAACPCVTSPGMESYGNSGQG